MENLKKMSIQEIREEAEKDYPPFTDEELRGFNFVCVGYSTDGGIDLITDSGGEIDIYMGFGEEHGIIRMSNPDDKKKFDDNFLRNTAMRFLKNQIPASFPSIYYYTKYIYPLKQKTENKRSSDNSR